VKRKHESAKGRQPNEGLTRVATSITASKALLKQALFIFNKASFPLYT